MFLYFVAKAWESRSEFSFYVIFTWRVLFRIISIFHVEVYAKIINIEASNLPLSLSNNSSIFLARVKVEDRTVFYENRKNLE